MTPVSAASANLVRAVLIPITGAQLLLPATCIAEVVNYTSPQPRDPAPPWFQGQLAWRGEIIPVVAMEHLLGSSLVPHGHRSRIVVCNALGETPGLDYIGILARALPRLVQVTPDNISPRKDGEGPPPGILAEAEVAGEPTLILDLDSIEAKLIELLELED